MATNPLTPPTAAPSELPTVTIVLNEQYVRYLLGAIEEFQSPSYWDISQADWDAYLALWVDELTAIIQEAT